eukprot:Phypoly_transcript_00086.p1 GENE.Phypoly_transcript_00086~~Phypoly_transcript_00086.p1  ORF type:complete len:2362 (+),score=414.48 Phypoly_transcript_00086:843-7088(+)
MARTHNTPESNMNNSLGGLGIEDGKEFGFPLYTSFSSLHDEEKESRDVKSWDASVFVDTVKELYPKLNWATVIKHLDHPGFLLTDQKGLALIASIYRKASKEPFPLEVLFSTLWLNTTGQLSFLKLALAAPPDVFNFATAPRRQSPIDALPSRSVPPLGPPPPPAAPPNSPWYSLALIETLLKLAETEHHTALRAIFDAPIKQCPELLLLGLTQVKPSWNNVLRAELISTLMTLFLGNHPTSSLVLHKLYHTAPSVVIRGMVEMYFKDPSSLSRLLDIAQDLKALNAILTTRPFSFVIDLAALASHREYLYLDKWLQDRINEHGAAFAVACITYIKEKLKLQTAQPFVGVKGQDKSPNFPLSPEIIASFFKALHNNTSILPSAVLDELKQLSPKPPSEVEVPTPPVGLLPQTGGAVMGASAAPGGTTHLVPPAAGPGLPTDPRVFPHEIEEEANSYFQRIYTGQLSIEDLVTLLKGFKSSKNSRELDVFACMIHNLFDEYRFFPKYPDKELRITGILFGSLIQHQLVSFLPLGVALKYVLDALRKPAGSKMFKFGLFALEQFKPRLYEWPQYCSHILAIPQIKSHHPDIIDIIEKALSQPNPGAQQSVPTYNPAISPPTVAQSTSPPPIAAPRTFPAPPPGLPPLPTLPQAHDITPNPPASGEFDQPTLGTALLLKSAKDIVQPDEQTKDKIHFIFNNVSQANMEIKANELRELLKEEYYDYMAQYLVVKRISIEQNFHPLYLTFLEKLNLPRLTQLILNYTLENIKTLLRSEKLKTDISERSVLKHLGSWLGLITLAKNKPLYHRDLCPKELLCLAYDQGTFVAVVPFVAKIMEACTQSKVFKPPNPWVVAIMRLMAEIYQLPDLKLNLKFEIELLCNNLQLDLNELKPTTLLVSRKLAHEDISKAPHDRPHSPEGSTPVLPSQPIDFINLPTFITYNQSITLFTQQPILKRVVPVAIERAIREIIAPVVERSVTIAVITTKELVSKDFATEPDEQKMRRAAHLMVQNMAGSLALVTCKEPLRVSMLNNLRPLLGNSEHVLPLVDHAINVLCADNLDLACAVIEKAATDRAVREIDDALSSSLALRRKYRERISTSGSFMDMSHLATRYALSIPDPLRPKTGGLQPHQLRVYEDFLLSPNSNSPTASPSSPSPTPSSKQPPSTPGSDTPIPDGAVDRSALNMIQIVPNITHNKPMPYIVHHGTVNQPTDSLARRGSASGLPGEVGEGALPQVKPPASSPPLSTIDKLGGILHELEKAAARVPPSSYSHLPPDHEVPQMIALIASLTSQLGVGNTAQKLEATAFLVQRILARLFDKSISTFQRTVFLSVLSGLREVVPRLSALTVTYLAQCSHEDEQYRRVVAALLASHLISCAQYDEVLARLLDLHRNQLVVDLAVSLLLDPQIASSPLEFPNTIDCLPHLLAPSNNNPKLLALLEIAKSREASKKDKASKEIDEEEKALLRASTSGMDQESLSSSASLIPDRHREQMTSLFQEFMLLVSDPNSTDKTFVQFFALNNNLQQSLRNEKVAEAFYRVCIEIAVESAFDKSSLAGLGAGIESVSYQAVDAFAKLVVSQVKFTGASAPAGSTPVFVNAAKIAVLNRVLNVVGKVLMQEYEMKKTKFNQRPYFRMFDNWLIEFNNMDTDTVVTGDNVDATADNTSNSTDSSASPDGGLADNAERSESESGTVGSSLHLQVLLAFGKALKTLRPSQFPGFAFAWLELISHRNFMAKLLLAKSQKGWPMFQGLLEELFRFLEPYLRSAELTEPIRLLYKGTLRVLLVLLHDFPEFLCDFHFSFCDVIPPSCIQMRNLILSAFPRAMRLPDPFTPNLKVDLLPEINQPPRILSNCLAALSTLSTSSGLPFKNEVDTYLKTRTPVSFLMDMRSRFLLLNPQDAIVCGTKYNVPVINSLVLYVGMQAIAQLQNKSSQVTPPIAHSAPMDIFQHLVLELDAEGRYLFLNAIANQLRYPNNHTHYFSCVLLYLFAEANQEIIQEQITRVLLERLIVNRPHPWGLLITFIELIKNQRYNFWSHAFTRCAPEIERLFESVARSCMGRDPKPDLPVNVVPTTPQLPASQSPPTTK